MLSASTGSGTAALSLNDGAARPVKTFSREELAERVDALALGIGSRLTASALLLACVVVILIGAQSLLSTMEGMDSDIKEMNEQLAIANAGLVILNETMDSVPPTARHLDAILNSVTDTSTEVKESVGHINTMTGTTAEVNGQMASISSSTTEMSDSLGAAAGDASQLNSTIGTLNKNIDPLVKTQHEMLLGTRRMRSGLDSMNDSLAYVIRIMNYLAAPPTGGGMTIRADLPRQTLPPLPGIKAEVDPVPVFPRGIWPIYRADPKTP